MNSQLSTLETIGAILSFKSSTDLLKNKIENNEIDWDEINTKNPCSPLQYKAQLVFDQDSGRLDGLDLDFDISGSCIYRMPNEIIKLVPQD